jgi:hypothetical protein
MNQGELIELIESARAFLPSEDEERRYHDYNNGEDYRTCCHAIYRYWPYNRAGNPHNAGCPAVRLAAALAAFDCV